MADGEAVDGDAGNPDDQPDTRAQFRDRLLAGMAAALRERDYADVTISDVVNHAWTSKRTFYEHFASKQECFVALLRQTNAEMARRIVARVEPDADWQVQVRQAVEGLVASVRADPPVFLNWIRAAHSLGASGRELSHESMNLFVTLMRTLADTPRLREAGVVPPSREVAIVLFGGIRELIAATLEEGGDIAGIVEVATSVVTLVLGPRPV